MAEALVTAVIGDMVSRVISHLTGNFRDQRSIKAKLRSIHHLLIKIQSVVEEAKGRQVTNHGVLEWLSELIDGMYQGRYLLDTFRYRYLEPADELSDMVVLPRLFSSSSFNPAKRLRVAVGTVKCLLFGDEGVNELNCILANLRTISGDLREFIILLERYRPIRWPLATNLYVESQMFGRHVERERVINFLRQSNGPSLAVLPIIGHTRVGKTTLVQHVCNDARVRNHFSLIMLYDFFCMRLMASSESRVVLRSKFVVGDMGNLDEPMEVLKHKLRGKRFLLVFENIDLHKKHMLEVLFPSLGCGKRGSKIIVTGNNKHVASIGTVEPIKLRVLPHPEYWFFFKALAFPGADIEENSRLVAIGKVIAERLKGSFFGAKIIGALLRAHPNPQFWIKILRSSIEEVSLIDKLSLFDDSLAYISHVAEKFLPSHVKMCTVTVTADCPRRTLPSLEDHSLSSPSAPLDIMLCKFSPNVASLNTMLDKSVFLSSTNVAPLDILLCKSVFPFYCLYYIAHGMTSGSF